MVRILEELSHLCVTRLPARHWSHSDHRLQIPALATRIIDTRDMHETHQDDIRYTQRTSHHLGTVSRGVAIVPHVA